MARYPSDTVVWASHYFLYSQVDDSRVPGFSQNDANFGRCLKYILWGFKCSFSYIRQFLFENCLTAILENVILLANWTEGVDIVIKTKTRKL